MNNDELLEAAMGDYFYAPSDVTVVERPEITYAYAPRESLLYNRVVKVRPQLGDVVELVAEVAEKHEGRSSSWHLNALGNDARLRDELEGAGYVPGHRHHAYVLAGEYERRAPKDVVVERVETRDDLLRLYAVRDEVFGASGPLVEEDIEQELALATGLQARVARFVAYRNGEPAGTGGVTFFEGPGIALIWAGGVREAHRGHGVYTALLRARFDAAQQRGIERLGLYARDTTSGPIVAAHGFQKYGAMVTWDRLVD